MDEQIERYNKAHPKTPLKAGPPKKEKKPRRTFKRSGIQLECFKTSKEAWRGLIQVIECIKQMGPIQPAVPPHVTEVLTPIVATFVAKPRFHPLATRNVKLEETIQDLWHEVEDVFGNSRLGYEAQLNVALPLASMLPNQDISGNEEATDQFQNAMLLSLLF